LRATVSEAQALAGSSIHGLNPLIFVRTKTPSPAVLDQMNTITLCDFFEQKEGDHAFSLSFFKSSLSSKDYENLVPTESDKAFVEQVKDFTPAEDA
jgi:hypothetical protein